jgi:anti-anti-sigma factor
MLHQPSVSWIYCGTVGARLPPRGQGVAMAPICVDSAGSDSSTITIRLSGAIDDAATEHLRSVLVRAIMRQRAATIVIDLEAVTTLDDAAIGTLRAAYQAANDVHLSLTFHDCAAVHAGQPDRDGAPGRHAGVRETATA